MQIKIGVLEEILMLLRQDETLVSSDSSDPSCGFPLRCSREQPDATGLFLDRSTKRTEQYMAKSKRAKCECPF